MAASEWGRDWTVEQLFAEQEECYTRAAEVFGDLATPYRFPTLQGNATLAVVGKPQGALATPDDVRAVTRDEPLQIETLWGGDELDLLVHSRRTQKGRADLEQGLFRAAEKFIRGMDRAERGLFLSSGTAAAVFPKPMDASSEGIPKLSIRVVVSPLIYTELRAPLRSENSYQQRTPDARADKVLEASRGSFGKHIESLLSWRKRELTRVPTELVEEFIETRLLETGTLSREEFLRVSGLDSLPQLRHREQSVDQEQTESHSETASLEQEQPRHGLTH